MKLRYIDRTTGKEKDEKIYGDFFIRLLYGHNLFSRILSTLMLPLIAGISLFSRCYGSIQKSRFSRFKIGPFIRSFHIDTEEFQDPVSSFQSFNDFFIRKLKLSCRPIARDTQTAILPADARYLVFPHIDRNEGFFVKGKKFSLASLLQDHSLAHLFSEGVMVIARLAPVDYHRFHFPCDGLAHTPRSIEGPLYSVNPLALKKNTEILVRNKRVITPIDTTHFGLMLFIEVGATYVGTIHQTFTPETFQKKGEEKGYFSFGGSCLILLFKPDTIRLCSDLVDASCRGLEVLGKFGQPLGKFEQFRGVKIETTIF